MNGHNVFLSGSGGTGKTFTVKKLVEFLTVCKNVAVTCTTDMACGLYDDALTLHSFVGLKSSRMDVDAVVKSIKGRQECYSRWQTTDVLIIDKISQLSRRTFDHVNIIAQKVRGIETKPFGGI